MASYKGKYLTKSEANNIIYVINGMIQNLERFKRQLEPKDTKDTRMAKVISKSLYTSLNQ